MATVRQLTTRFSFETDRSGVRRFNKAITGMKRGIVGLGAAIGATKIVKSFLTLGSNVEDAVAKVRRFTDEVRFTKNNAVALTGAMAESWKDVSDAIPGKVIMSDFLNGFFDFKQFIKGGTLQQFNKLFVAAGRIAKISGRPVAEVFAELREAAKSGDLSDLQKVLKGVDVSDVAMANFVKQLRAVDPTGVATISDRISGFFKVLQANEGELDRFSRQIVFGTFGGQMREFKTNLRDIGETIGAKLTRPMRGAITATNKFFTEWSEGGFTWKALVKTMGERSIIFGDALDGIGTAAGVIATGLDFLFQKAKTGFQALDDSIRERGYIGTAEVILDNLNTKLIELSGQFKEFIGLGGPSGFDKNAARMQRQVLGQTITDDHRKGRSAQQDSLGRSVADGREGGRIVVVQTPITIVSKGGDAGEIATKLKDILGRDVKTAIQNFGPKESGRPR